MLTLIIDVYKVILIEVLKTEFQIKFLNMHINNLQIKFKTKIMADEGMTRNRKAGDKIIGKLRKFKGRRRKAVKTSGERKYEGAGTLLSNEEDLHRPKGFPAWGIPLIEAEQQKERIFQAGFKNKVKKHDAHFLKAWQQSGDNYRGKIQHPNAAQKSALTVKSLKLHKNMKKAANALTIQIKTKKIDFANFLFMRKMPDVKSFACKCEYFKKTVKHVLLFCSQRPDKKRFREAGPMNYRFFTKINKKLKTAINGMMGNNLLRQFTVIRKLMNHNE